MDIIYRLGEASVTQVLEEMVRPPSYSTVRTLMGTLSRKGQLTHTTSGPRYLYRPVVERSVAQRSALARIVENFFGGSAERAAVALLEMSDLDEARIGELRTLVNTAKEQGR